MLQWVSFTVLFDVILGLQKVTVRPEWYRIIPWIIKVFEPYELQLSMVQVVRFICKSTTLMPVATSFFSDKKLHGIQRDCSVPPHYPALICDGLTP